MNISELLELAAERPTEVQRASGVSRATIKRIRDGASEPTLSTLQELAAALGYELRINVVPSGDPYAAVAARGILEGELIPDQASVWANRFARRGPQTPEQLVRAAGLLSSVKNQSGARFYLPKNGISPRRALLATASAAKPSRYAISGAPAASLLLEGRIPGPTILWSEDPDHVATRLTDSMLEAPNFQPAGLTLVSAPPEILEDLYEEGGVTYASPLQVVLDLHGLGLPHLADEISKDW